MNDKNQGEGDRRSAKRFNERQQDFVESDRGQQKVEQDHSVPENVKDRHKEAKRKTRS